MYRIIICLVIVFAGAATSQRVHGTKFIFGEPTNLGSLINSSQSDYAHISSDGLSLYVSRGFNFGPSKIYVSHRADTSDAWGPLDIASGEVIDGAVGVPTTTSDGLSMFFSGRISNWSGSVRQGGLGGGDIWLSERSSIDSEFGEPTNLGAPINTKYVDSDPRISADGLMMVFSSTRPNGFGENDLWESRRASIGAAWEEPQNLGPLVNHGGVDQTPWLSADGLMLIYSIYPGSHGFDDLWATTRDDVDSPWIVPQDLGTRVNTSFSEFNPQLSADESTLYFSQWTSLCNTARTITLCWSSRNKIPNRELGASSGSLSDDRATAINVEPVTRQLTT